MTTIAQIPSFDVPPPDARPSGLREVRDRPASRRGVLKGLAVGGMALGATVVGWIPLAKPAHATVGTEWTSCSIYSYDGVLCVGAPYSSGYCGSDKWFKNGCFRAADNYVDCYEPTKACNSRNAWRWSGYRCADGYYTPYGGTRVFRICSARL